MGTVCSQQTVEVLRDGHCDLGHTQPVQRPAHIRLAEAAHSWKLLGDLSLPGMLELLKVRAL